MDSVSSQCPCMPTPIMPKRTRSLAATAPGAGMRLCGNETIGFAASDAPAAALAPRNSRRDQLFFFTASPMSDEVAIGRLPHYGGPLGRLALATIPPAPCRHACHDCPAPARRGCGTLAGRRAVRGSAPNVLRRQDRTRQDRDARHGGRSRTALRRGNEVLVTKVKVKKDLIEFQLG